MGEFPSPPFSSLICQGKPSHSRLTQREAQLEREEHLDLDVGVTQDALVLFEPQDRNEAAQLIALNGGGSEEDIDLLAVKIAAQRVEHQNGLAIEAQQRLERSEGKTLAFAR
jgi:hypothetical protein